MKIHNKIIYLLISLLFLSKACALNLIVKFEGINAELEKKISSNLLIYKAQKEKKLNDMRIYNLHNEAPKQIISTLEALGYYNSSVKADLEMNNNEWLVTYKIIKGPATILKVATITIEGEAKQDSDLKDISSNNLKLGKILIHSEYEDAKQDLINTIQGYGYLQARIKVAKIEVDRDTNIAKVIILINSGPKYKFGKVEFIAPPFNVDFLEGFIPFAYKEPYSREKINELQRNFRDANMFAKARVFPQPDLRPNDPDLLVPIKIKLTKKPANRYSASAGYGTDTGPRVAVGWQHRRRQTSGHKVNTGLEISKIKKNTFLNYTIPGNHPAKDKYVFANSIQERKVNSEYSIKAEANLTHIKKRIPFERHFSLQYITESFRLSDQDKITNKQFLIPNAKLIYTKKDEAQNWSCGYRIDATAKAGSKSIISDTDFIQGEIQSKFLLPVFPDWRLMLRGLIGITKAEDFKQLPPTLRYFAGGDRSVRGFKYRSLGPKGEDSKGNIINLGGKHNILGTIELEKKIISDLSAAVFYDIGNSLDNFSDPLAAGTGFGLRYATAIGSFRLDIAKQVKLRTNKHLRYHITFGTDL